MHQRLAEIEKGETTDGKVAYIKALFNHYANDRGALKAYLQALPDSFNNGYLFTREKYGLTLLLNTDKPLFAGTLGKEKIVDLALTARQRLLLFALAAHQRGFEFTTLPDTIILHPYGWIECQNKPELQRELIELAELFKRTEFVIENQKDKFFRLSVAPDNIYFDNQLFSYSVSTTDLTITRAAITTALGMVADKSEVFYIPKLLAIFLAQPTAYSVSEYENEVQKIRDDYKYYLAKKANFLALGLKRLIAQEDKLLKCC